MRQHLKLGHIASDGRLILLHVFLGYERTLSRMYKNKLIGSKIQLEAFLEVSESIKYPKELVYAVRFTRFETAHFKTVRFLSNLTNLVNKNDGIICDTP